MGDGIEGIPFSGLADYAQRKYEESKNTTYRPPFSGIYNSLANKISSSLGGNSNSLPTIQSMAGWGGANAALPGSTPSANIVNQSNWQGASTGSHAGQPVVIRNPGGDPPPGGGDPPPGGGGGGGFEGGAFAAPALVADTWVPIPIPDMNVQLSPSQIEALLKEAGQFGDLKYDPLLTEYANQDVANTKWGINTIANEKPEWYSSMRNIANQVANALGEYATKTNTLGRFESGQLGSGISAIQAGGLNQIGTLESGLTKRIGNINDMVKDKAESIATLRAGVEREKGLTVALQNATLQREAIQNEKDTRSRMFDMALASASDARDQQRLTIAKNEFTTKVDEMLYQRTVTERSLALQQESAALENALTQKQIDNYDATIKGYSSGPKEEDTIYGYFTDPTTGAQIPITNMLDMTRANDMYNSLGTQYQDKSNLPDRATLINMINSNGKDYIYNRLGQDFGLSADQINSMYNLGVQSSLSGSRQG